MFAEIFFPHFANVLNFRNQKLNTLFNFQFIISFASFARKLRDAASYELRGSSAETARSLSSDGRVSATTCKDARLLDGIGPGRSGGVSQVVVHITVPLGRNWS